MSKKLASLCIRISPELQQELTQEADEQRLVLSDYARGILARRKLVSSAPPGLEELQNQVSSLEKRLAEANRELKSWGMKPV